MGCVESNQSLSIVWKQPTIQCGYIQVADGFSDWYAWKYVQPIIQQPCFLFLFLFFLTKKFGFSILFPAHLKHVYNSFQRSPMLSYLTAIYPSGTLKMLLMWKVVRMFSGILFGSCIQKRCNCKMKKRCVKQKNKLIDFFLYLFHFIVLQQNLCSTLGSVLQCFRIQSR